MTVWCVEDDDGIRELIVYTLRGTGFVARGFADGISMEAALELEHPDLVLLDLMLPGKSGLEILQTLRREKPTSSLPVIIVTARGAEYDKVLGLDSGADDYIAKPFGMMELISRINAVLRRVAPVQIREELYSGAIVLDPAGHRVTVSETDVTLTQKEFDLLQLLIRHKGEAVSRDRLLDEVWGYKFDGGTRTIDMHIRALRQKLGNQGKLIETVRGVGYRLQDREAV